MKFIIWILNALPDAIKKFKEWRRANEVERIHKAVGTNDDVYITNKLRDIVKSESRRTSGKR